MSVVMPVVDEERHLAEAVRRILSQAYDGDLELVIAVGPSRDRTRAVADRLAAADSRVQVVDNPSGRTPAGLNAAIAGSRHPVLVRVDGHGLLTDGYVRDAVDLLLRTGAENVGGMMVPEGTTPFERAVAVAMSSGAGIGTAKFHVGGEEGPADTVYLGVFRRDALEAVGGFDEDFVRAQDWELNHRLRTAGGTVWFSPRLRVLYRPRSDVRALAQQFFRTGQWRRQVSRRYPDTLNLRYAAPPAAVLGVVVGTAAGTVGLAAGVPVLLLGWLGPVGYLGVVGVATAALSRRTPPGSRRWLAVVLATMHLTWGAGFLLSPRRLS